MWKSHLICSAVLPIRWASRRRCDSAATWRERHRARGVHESLPCTECIYYIYFIRKCRYLDDKYCCASPSIEHRITNSAMGVHVTSHYAGAPVRGGIRASDGHVARRVRPSAALQTQRPQEAEGPFPLTSNRLVSHLCFARTHLLRVT